MDPQAAISLAGPEHFARRIRKKASYEYSHASMMLYLGLRDIDLTDYGYGNYNRWHLEQWDMNRCWDELMTGNYERPWLFMATPTLHTHDTGIAPKGSQILEILTLANYDLFADAKRRNKQEYEDLKFRVAGRMLDIVEEHYVPNLRQHIAKWAYGSPTTNEDFVLAPRGNAYGSHMTPSNMGLDRMRAQTGLRNFYWCSASSGYAGIFGTVRTGVILYMNLTGDWFWQPEQTPSDDTLIRSLRYEGLTT
jgi:phytoene dehydrogenase-like protein